MLKLVTAVCLITAMAVVISIIDAKSSGVVGSRQTIENRRDSNRKIYATGIVEGATQDIELRFEQAGRVAEVLALEGQWVNAGDVLVRLDSNRQQQEVALASARLELAKAELERLQNGARSEEREEASALAQVAEARVEQAVRNLKINERLRIQRAVTQQETDDQQSLVDTSKSELEAAQARAKQLEAPARADELRAANARVAAAEAELNLAKVGQAKTELRAPCRSRVLEIHAEPGELTGPDVIKAVAVLSNISTIRVRAYVEELDAPRMQMDMPASVTADGLPDRSFTGHIVRTSPRMASKSVQSDRPSEMYDTKVREVILELNDAAQLIVGLRVNVEFDAGLPDGHSRGT